jgi:hypothetical protein
LLKLYDKYNMSSWHYHRTYYDLFQLAVTKRKSLQRASAYIRKAYDAVLAFSHDETYECVQKMKSLTDSPQIHRNYLLLD